MTRGLTGAFQSAVAGPHVQAVVFAQLDFAEGVTRLCTAGHSLEWSGFTWLGAGTMLGVSIVEESSTLEAHGLDLTLSGCTPELLTAAQTYHYQGRAVDLWFAPLDDSLTPITDPYPYFSGRMDYSTISTDGAVIVLHCSSWFEDWQRARVRRYTDADQQREYPGDRFFEFAEQVADAQLVWYSPGGSAPSGAPVSNTPLARMYRLAAGQSKSY